jgi:RNA polymerase sigma-70 factor (ECF subfamily)
MTDPKKGLVERLFSEQRRSLQAFFLRRVRTKWEAADLAQEVYLRMLRVPDADAIRNPEHYLYAVAQNLMKEQAIVEQRRASALDVDDPIVQQQLSEPPVLDTAIDTANRSSRLREVLAQLSPKCRAAVILQYRDGLSYQEIGERIGVSPNMVKKYLSQALAHCRKRMASLE